MSRRSGLEGGGNASSVSPYPYRGDTNATTGQALCRRVRQNAGAIAVRLLFLFRLVLDRGSAKHYDFKRVIAIIE